MKLSELRTTFAVAWPSSGDVSYMSAKGGFDMDFDAGIVRVVKGDMVRLVPVHNVQFMVPAPVVGKTK